MKFWEILLSVSFVSCLTILMTSFSTNSFTILTSAIKLKWILTFNFVRLDTLVYFWRSRLLAPESRVFVHKEVLLFFIIDHILFIVFNVAVIGHTVYWLAVNHLLLKEGFEVFLTSFTLCLYRFFRVLSSNLKCSSFGTAWGVSWGRVVVKIVY